MPKDTNPNVGLCVSIGQATDAGVKPGNQDFHGALVPVGRDLTMKGIAVALADGISSSPVSAEAAETAVKALMTDYYCTPDAWTVKTAASRVIAATNSWLHAQNRRARLDSMDRGRVCTFSALILKGRTAHLFHVGDSRIWRLAGDTLEPLTTDHRVVLSSEESYLGRALGAEPAVEIDYRALPLSRDDVFLLTTDGVHDHWDPRAVAHRLGAATDLDAEAARFVGDALAAGSRDNLTVQIVRIDRLPAPEAADLSEVPLTLAPPSLPRDGDEIDGFRILRQIHANSRSHIYLAAAPDGTRVALKIPSVDLRGDADYLRRFVMEEWIARRLDSPHVLRAGPAPVKRSALYTVAEFIEGQTLRQWMADNPAPPLETVRGIVEQIVAGLRAFHRREMLHQDLRPENVLIDRDGTARIIDFGSTHVAGVAEAAPIEEPMLGTLQYSAPEYFTGDPVGPSADQFSLGVIAYEMLTGRLPYGAGAARVRTRADVKRLTYRPAAAGRLPDWVDDALRKAVDPDPARRHAALSEFVAALRAPGGNYRPRRDLPLAERDPVRFWQGVSALLALTAIVLAALLAR